MRVRTGYSFGAVYGHIEDVARFSASNGFDAAPITDRASTFGWNKWAALTSKHGKRPVFGLELAVSPQYAAKDRAQDYWTFYARDDIGVLNRLLQTATAQFKWEPVLSIEQAINTDGVEIVTGGQMPLEHMQHLTSFKNLWIALSPSLSHGALKGLHEQGHSFVLSNDNYYPTPDDEKYYHLIAGRQASSQTYPRHLMGANELGSHLVGRGFDLYPSFVDDANLAAEGVLARCTAALKAGHLYHPAEQVDLRDECLRGAVSLGIRMEGEYRDRLTRELDIIGAKGFGDYFRIVGDLVRWSRGQMLVGPARGSSCGSLVCYLLGITTVDPLKHGLLFERFIDINRSDLPDIDIDFSDQKRARVFDYMEKKYGRSQIARLGTVSLYRQRSALAVGCAAYGIPKWRGDVIADAIEPRAAGDQDAYASLADAFDTLPAARKLAAECPQIVHVAKLEGHPRHYSQHAAGLILTDKAVTDYVALDARTNATQCDKKDAEDLNLLKIDCLGLTQLSVFEDAFEMKARSTRDLLDLNGDDPAALDIFNKGDFLGIFQFNGKALQGITRQVKVESLDDIVAITALARPGPLNSGMTQQWIDRKKGQSAVTFPHELFADILRPTLGVIVYQEQIMQMCRAVGMSWPDVIAVRKAMGKSQGAQAMEKYREVWMLGCFSNDITEYVARTLWNEMCEFGAYAFNKSHSVAYAIISYWCAWCKVYMPLQFAAATLSHEEDADKQIEILRALDEQGITYKAFDPKHSGAKWAVAEGMLIGPISNVVGIGPKALDEILQFQAGNLPKLSDSVAKKIAGGKTKLASLWPIRDAINLAVPDLTKVGIHAPTTDIATLNSPAYNSGWDGVIVLALVERIAIKDENDAATVARRGFKLPEDKPTKGLNVFIRDDTGSIFAKVTKERFETIGKQIMDKGKAEKSLFAFRGTVRDGEFRMLTITKAMYLGERK